MLTGPTDIDMRIPSSTLICVARHSLAGYNIIYVDNEGSTEQLPIGTVKCIAASILPPEVVDTFGARNLLPRPKEAASRPGHQPSAVHVVVSTASGTWKAEDFFETRLSAVLQALGLTADKDFAVHHTSSEKSVSELTTEVFIPAAARGVEQNILLLSGDGGMVDIINATMLALQHLHTSAYVKPVVALLPLGTANALAHSLKVTADDTMGISTLLRGNARALTAFRATFSPGAGLLTDEGNTRVPLPLINGINTLWGCVVCSWGFHASLVADSDTTEYRKHGIGRFQLAAKENLFPEDGSSPHEYRGKLSVLRSGRWEPLERDSHAYVLATFVSNLEKTFTISPASKPLDRQLRLVHFGPMGGADVMQIMGAAYQGGKHVEDDRVGYGAIDGLKIEFDEDDARWRRVCVDGKIVSVEKSGWVEMIKEESDVVDVLCMTGDEHAVTVPDDACNL